MFEHDVDYRHLIDSWYSPNINQDIESKQTVFFPDDQNIKVLNS